MILLEPGNRILGETVSAQIIREKSDEAESKRDPIDVRLHDFDDTSYRIVIDKDARDTMRVSMSMPCYKAIEKVGGAEAVEKHYKEFAVDPESGMDVTLSINLNEVKGKPEDLIAKLSMLKANVLGGVFDHYFTNLLKKGKPMDRFQFNLRSDTIIYLVPSADRLTVVFSLDFKEKVDRAVAKIFMQEFVDARRTLGAAPPVAWNTNPPLELKEFGVTEPTGNLGFITFSVMASNVDRDKKEKVVAVLQSFRSYLQYHIKCSKSFFHSRMRERVKSLLVVLNRARQEPIGESKEKKTITGRTFTRAS